jgi:fructokinase
VNCLPINRSGLVIVTEGSRGATAFWKGSVVRSPGFKVEVAETTGCGDAFMAGMITRRVPYADDGLDSLSLSELEAALRFSNACAAIVATRRGAANSMPYPAEVSAFLDAHPV